MGVSWRSGGRGMVGGGVVGGLVLIWKVVLLHL